MKKNKIKKLTTIIGASTLSIGAIAPIAAVTVSCSCSSSQTDEHSSPNNSTNPSNPVSKKSIEFSLKHNQKLDQDSSLDKQTSLALKPQRMLTAFVNGNPDSLYKEVDYADIRKQIIPDSEEEKKIVAKYFVDLNGKPLNILPYYLDFPNTFVLSNSVDIRENEYSQDYRPILTKKFLDSNKDYQYSGYNPKKFDYYNVLPNYNVPKLNVIAAPSISGNYASLNHNSDSANRDWSYRETAAIYYKGTNNPVTIDDVLTMNLYFSSIEKDLVKSLYNISDEDANKVYVKFKFISRCDNNYNIDGINQYIGNNLLMHYSLAIKPKYENSYYLNEQASIYDALVSLDACKKEVSIGQDWDEVLKTTGESSWGSFLSNKSFGYIDNLVYNEQTKKNEIQTIHVNDDYRPLVSIKELEKWVKKPLGFGRKYSIFEPNNDLWVSYHTYAPLNYRDFYFVYDYQTNPDYDPSNNENYYIPMVTNANNYYNFYMPDAFNSSIFRNGILKKVTDFSKPIPLGYDKIYEDLAYKVNKNTSNDFVDSIQNGYYNSWGQYVIDSSDYFKKHAQEARTKLFQKYFKVLLELNKQKDLINQKYSTIFWCQEGAGLSNCIVENTFSKGGLYSQNSFIINNPLFNNGFGYRGDIDNIGPFSSSNIDDPYYINAQQSVLVNYLATESSVKSPVYNSLAKFLFSNNFPINIFSDDPNDYDYSHVDTDLSYYQNVAKFYSYLFFNDTSVPFHENKLANGNQRLYLINWFPEINMGKNLMLSPDLMDSGVVIDPSIENFLSNYSNPSFGTYFFANFYRLPFQGSPDTKIKYYGSIYSFLFQFGMYADVQDGINNLDFPSRNVEHAMYYGGIAQWNIIDYGFNDLYDMFLRPLYDSDTSLQQYGTYEQVVDILEHLLNPAKVPIDAKNWLI